MKRTILITGGLGFIGINIAKYLLKVSDCELLLFDKFKPTKKTKSIFSNQEISRLSFSEGDILKSISVNRAMKRADIVIHLAADTHTFRSLTKPLSTIRTNVIGTTIILNAAKKHNVERFILFSSSEVYGNQIPGVPMDENHSLNPVTPYAASKLSAEKIAQSFYNSFGFPVIIFRPFNAYGPFQHPEKMIPLFITRLLKGEKIYINHGGVQKRDWVYVEDHARAVHQAINASIEKAAGHAFNIGSDKSTSVLDVAKVILKIMGKDETQIVIKKSADSQVETMGNVGISKKANSVLNWQTKTNLTNGIKKTYIWYKEHRDWWEKL